MDHMANTTLPKPASLLLRVLAAILDSALVFMAWYYIIEAWGNVAPAAGDTAVGAGDKSLTGIPALALMLGTAAYWIIPEWLQEATLGKAIFSLRVASVDGKNLTFGQVMKRNVLRLIDFFPFYLTGFLAACLTPNRQRLGDLWAKTIVVSSRSRQPNAGAAPSQTV